MLQEVERSGEIQVEKWGGRQKCVCDSQDYFVPQTEIADWEQIASGAPSHSPVVHGNFVLFGSQSRALT